MIELNTQNHAKNNVSNGIDWKNIRKNISFFVEDNVWNNVSDDVKNYVSACVLRDLRNHIKLK